MPLNAIFIDRSHRTKSWKDHEVGSEITYKPLDVMERDKLRVVVDAVTGRSKSWPGIRTKVDPEVLEAVFFLVGFHVEAGSKSIEEVTDALIDEIGRWIIPYVPRAYEDVRRYPGLEVKGMSTIEEVRAYFLGLPRETRAEWVAASTE